jgi:ribosome-associated toxin RatA of RatAB toxin-antitoxin module
MRSTLSIDVEAPARLVFDLARDVQRWPALLPHYRDVRVEEREAQPRGAVTARMLAIRPIVPVLGYGIPVAWRSRTWAEEGTLRLRFVHCGGATNGMDVTWRIEETTAGCRVSIDHVFNARVPGWPALVHRLFVRPIATRTLASFKAIAEAVAPAMVAPAIAAPAARSTKRKSTKTST